MPAVSNERCDRCGYDLTGLGLVGQCPECGRRYDVLRREGVRDAASSVNHRQQTLARIRTIVLGAITAAILVGGAVAALLVPNPGGAIWMGILLGLLMAMATATSYLYEKPEP